MIIIFTLLGYGVIGGWVFGYVAAKTNHADDPMAEPYPFFSGVFWPIVCLMLLAQAPKNFGVRCGLAMVEREQKRAYRLQKINEAKLLAEKEVQEAMAELENPIVKQLKSVKF